MTNTVPADTATTTAELVYIGRRPSGDGKLAHWYLPLVDGALDGEMVGSYKPWVTAPIGAIVTVHHPVDEPRQTYTSGRYAPAVTDAWHDVAAITEWRTVDSADSTAHTIAARARRDLQGLPDEFAAAVAVLRSHFQPLNNNQRTALMALVQTQILRG